MLTVRTSDTEIFLERLKGEYDIFDVTESVVAPKEYFFPPEETTFTFSIKHGKLSTPAPPRRFVLYGLSLMDLGAITYLDEIMSTPEPDYYYFRRRERALLVGVTDEPFDLPPGGDIILSDIDGDAYRVLAVTARGAGVIKKYMPRTKTFREPPSRPRSSGEGTMPGLKRLLMDAEYLKDAVQWSWKGYQRIWERLEEKCLGCGICTYVCPHCHCFSMEDGVDLSGETARRRRKWDACTLPGFAKLAGGKDFHPALKQRYYNWFYHKFVRAYLEFGRAQCVACGRCRDQCPARIDIEEVLMDIAARYEKHRRS